MSDTIILSEGFQLVDSSPPQKAQKIIKKNSGRETLVGNKSSTDVVGKGRKRKRNENESDKKKLSICL